MDIIAEILKIAQKGAKKTHIVYKANLNFKVLREYVEKMEQAGLITILEEKRKTIKTTDKGLIYLENYNGFMKYVETVVAA
jgi:predicted transcriptional regulator